MCSVFAPIHRVALVDRFEENVHVQLFAQCVASYFGQLISFPSESNSLDSEQSLNSEGESVAHVVIARNSGHSSLPSTADIFRKQDGGNDPEERILFRQWTTSLRSHARDMRTRIEESVARVVFRANGCVCNVTENI